MKENQEYQYFQCRLPIWMLDAVDKAEKTLKKNKIKVIKIPKKAIVALLWEHITSLSPTAEHEITTRLLHSCGRVQSKLDGNRSIYALDEKKYTKPTKALLPIKPILEVNTIASKNYKTMTKAKTWMLCIIICNYTKEMAQNFGSSIEKIIIDAAIAASQKKHRIVHENE